MPYDWKLSLGPRAYWGVNQMRHNLQSISIPHFRLEIGFQIETDLLLGVSSSQIRQTPRDALDVPAV